jgi:hypothetical protein
MCDLQTSESKLSTASKALADRLITKLRVTVKRILHKYGGPEHVAADLLGANTRPPVRARLRRVNSSPDSLRNAGPRE